MELEIWSDIACPWCYVGKKRMEKALAEYKAAGIQTCLVQIWTHVMEAQ